MKWFFITVLCLTSFSFRVAAADTTVTFDNKSYSIEFPKPPVVTIGSRKIRGRFEERMAEFSHWSFVVDEKTNTGFELIFNERNRKILYVKNNLDAGGPFLLAQLSPDYVIFDYGTGPSGREFELRDGDGRVLWKDGYWGNQMDWIGGGILYSKETDNNLLADTTSEVDHVKCADMGMNAVKIEKFEYNIASHASKKRTDSPSHIECAQ